MNAIGKINALLLAAITFAAVILLAVMMVPPAEAQSGPGDPTPKIRPVKVNADRVLFNVDGEKPGTVKLLTNGNVRPLNSCAAAEYCFFASNANIRSVDIEASNSLGGDNTSRAGKSWFHDLNGPFPGDVLDAPDIVIRESTLYNIKFDTYGAPFKNVRLFWNNEYKPTFMCDGYEYCYRSEFPLRYATLEAQGGDEGVKTFAFKELVIPR